MGERILAFIRPGPRLVTWLLTSLMMSFLFVNIIHAEWSNGWEPMRGVGLVAILTGALLARWESFPAVGSHLLALLLGIGVTINRLDHPRLDGFMDKANDLLIRALTVFRASRSGGSTEDFYLFAISGLLLAWLIGYATIWLLFKHGWGWRAVLFNGLLLMLNLTFTPNKSGASFWMFLLTGLVLIVFETFRQRQERWDIQALDQQEWLSLRFLWSGLIACALLIFLSGRLPATITNAQLKVIGSRLTKPFDSLSRWLNLPGTDPEAVGSGVAPAPARANFANSSVSLGGARSSTNAIVLEVRSSQAEYWRSNAWDLYNGRGWENTTGQLAQQILGTSTRRGALTSVGVQNTMPQLDESIRKPLTQTIILRQDRADQQLPAATTPYSWSIPILSQNTFIETPGGEGVLPNFTDSSIYFAQGSTTAGISYTVVSLISTADKQSLRQSDTDYPAWTQRYLQLPNTPELRRIAGLARQLVAGADATNPYDKAVAIERYLRSMPYDDQIPAPPPGADPIANFLFELKRGYCDYFAGSMVLMLRSQGVPARWVQGYATGEFDPEAGAYIVRDSIAHSWPEVYFTGYGWIRFEPTPAGYATVPQLAERPPSTFDENNPEDIGPNGGQLIQPAPSFDPEQIRELQEQMANQPIPPTPLPQNLPPEDMVATTESTSPIVRWLMICLTIIALILVVVWYLVRRETQGLSPVARAYATVGLLARWAGLGQRPEHTPKEFANELSKTLRGDRPALQRLADAYTNEQYSRVARADITQVQHDTRQVSSPLRRRAFRRVGRNLWEMLMRQRERSQRRKE